MKKIFLAGHKGMVGSAILRLLNKNFSDKYEVLTVDRNTCDLRNQIDVRNFMSENNPDAVIIAAAKVGGIHANNVYPADFIYENLSIQNNLIHESYLCGISRLLFLGSSCIYPRDAEQPMNESALLSGKLEKTNEPYAIAKIAGIKMCESYNRQYGTDFRSIMPTNLYGEGDNFHLENAHVLPALIRRFHEAVENKSKEVAIWGTGSVYREFLHVDDMADASMFIFNLNQSLYKSNTSSMESHINVGSGNEVTIKDLAYIIGDVVGFKGNLSFDTSKPDGTPRKLLDSSKIEKIGWKSSISLKKGIQMTYDWFKANQGNRF